jgi:hypothetical protein
MMFDVLDDSFARESLGPPSSVPVPERGTTEQLIDSSEKGQHHSPDLSGREIPVAFQGSSH